MAILSSKADTQGGGASGLPKRRNALPAATALQNTSEKRAAGYTPLRDRSPPDPAPPELGAKRPRHYMYSAAYL
jgi:hypothetical protein